ncbi:hypothetical protein [Brevibacillus brevis]|uniref:hypothetical protein n=1 Tax=Brevibacillus brevis TaxID=1393 RepID=UPI0007D8AE78|nr:hypothetical protein [Brevibacillus brevis]
MKHAQIVTGLLVTSLAIVGCSEQQQVGKQEVEVAQEQTMQTATETKPIEQKVDTSITKTQEEKATEVKSEESKISTEVFVYAKSVDINDSRELTQHIDVVVHMHEELTDGLATQHVLTQTYDFLQQEDIKGAKTVTIGVEQGDNRVSQFTVDVAKFKAGEHLIKSILDASTIDKMSDEVKEHGKIMELW